MSLLRRTAVALIVLWALINIAALVGIVIPAALAKILWIVLLAGIAIFVVDIITGRRVL